MNENLDDYRLKLKFTIYNLIQPSIINITETYSGSPVRVFQCYI